MKALVAFVTCAVMVGAGLVGGVCGAVGQRERCEGEGSACGPDLLEFHRLVSLLVLRIDG